MQYREYSNGSSSGPSTISTGEFTSISTEIPSQYDLPEQSHYVTQKSSPIIENIRLFSKAEEASNSSLRQIKEILDQAIIFVKNAIDDFEYDLTRESHIASFSEMIHQLVPYIDINLNFQDMVFLFISIIEINFAKKLSLLQLRTIYAEISNFRKHVFPSEEQITNSITHLEKHKLYITV